MFHSFNEVDVDLATWWPVAQRDWQWHAEEEFTVMGRVKRECLMVCVWVPNLHEEMDQNDYCGTTRSG